MSVFCQVQKSLYRVFGILNKEDESSSVSLKVPYAREHDLDIA
jgi:hypothetical protein